MVAAPRPAPWRRHRAVAPARGHRGRAPTPYSRGFCARIITSNILNGLSANKA